MKFFAVILGLALVASNEAFIGDTWESLKSTLTEVLNTLSAKLPYAKRDVEHSLALLEDVVTDPNERITQIQSSLQKLSSLESQMSSSWTVRGVLNTLSAWITHGKRDVEHDSLALLEDAVTDTKERLDQMQTFLQKLSEARKAGNVQEVLTNHLKEQREKYLQRLTPEQRQKYEEHVKQLKETHATWTQKMAEYKKTQETCRTAVQTAKDAAAKTAETTDGSRMQLFKVYTDCLKDASQKTEVTKTQEDASSFKESMEKFRMEFLEAQKNGKLAEFLKTHHENVKSKLAEMHKTMISKITDEQNARLEQHKQSSTALTSTLQTCRTQVTALKNVSRFESAKAFVKCMLEARNAQTETKTQEDAVRMTAAERAELMKKYEEAKKAGTLREFLQKHHEEQHKQAEEARKAYMLKRTECMKKVEEAKKPATDVTKFDARVEMRNCMSV